jgi:hypothetical protein
MSDNHIHVQRRTVLQISAGLAAGTSAALATALTALTAQPALTTQTAQTARPSAALAPAATGKAGDFDFLTGEWKIKNRQLKQER